MHQRIVGLAVVASALVACSGSSGGSSGGTTGGSSSSGSSSGGSSSGSSGSCPSPTTVAAARASCNQGQTANIASATVLYSEPATKAAADGGTASAISNYILLDSTGLGILAYHDDVKPNPGYAPSTADVITASGGISTYPTGNGEIRITAPMFSFVSHGTLPTPATATAAQLTAHPTDSSMTAHYVTVPAGTYTQSATEPAFAKYSDGVSITDGSGNKILVFFYPLEGSSTACYPSVDGGNPDLSHGGFNGFYDLAETDDGNVNGVILYGNCGQ